MLLHGVITLKTDSLILLFFISLTSAVLQLLTIRLVNCINFNIGFVVHIYNYYLGPQSTAEDSQLIHVIDKIDKPLDLKPAVVAASQASVSIVHIPGPVTLSALHNGPIAPTAHLPENGEPDPPPALPLLCNHVSSGTVPMVHVQANHASALSCAVTSHVHPHSSAAAHLIGGGIATNMGADLKPEV